MRASVHFGRQFEPERARVQGNTPSTTTRRKPTEGYGGSAQPPSPGSPLTYGPQLAMQPMSRVPEYSSKSSADIPFTCPAQPKLVPTAIACAQPHLFII